MDKPQGLSMIRGEYWKACYFQFGQHLEILYMKRLMESVFSAAVSQFGKRDIQYGGQPEKHLAAGDIPVFFQHFDFADAGADPESQFFLGNIQFLPVHGNQFTKGLHHFPLLFVLFYHISGMNKVDILKGF